MQNESTLTQQIINELYGTLVLLGADNGLLGTVGSWGDSLPDENVLSGLKTWNKATIEETKQCIEHYETSCRRPTCNQDELAKTSAAGR
jgi:hypothetical protein